MQYKNTKKIILDQRKLETLFRIGCPDNLIIELLKTGTFTPTGDSLIDDNLESLIDHKIFNNNNWGGKRECAGAPKGNTNAKKNNQNNQDNNQDENQDTDIDIDKENKGGVGGKETKKMAANELIKKFAQSFKAPPMNATVVGKTPIPPAMQQFLETEFTPAEITRLKHWLTENKSGEVMKNESILRAACTIANKKYPDVFARFLRFDTK